MEFFKGLTDPVGDCGNFAAGIDVHGANQFPQDSRKRIWYSRVECYGKTAEHANELRDKVLALLVYQPPAPVLASFRSIPYGTKFRYQGSQEVWVRTQYNVIAEWTGALATAKFQSLCCFCHEEGDEDGNTMDSLVEVVGDSFQVPPQPIYDEAKERELFEVSATSALGRDSDGYYLATDTYLRWQGWKACAQSRAKSVEVGDE